MNIYKKNRIKLQIPTIEMANMLEIPEEKYLEIESGDRPMPKGLISKFMTAVYKKTETKGDFNIKMLDINLWFKQSDLKQLRCDFGYDTQKELAKELDIHHSTISRIENKDLEHVSNELKLKIYNFFTNELNKKINKSTTEKLITKNENERKIKYIPDKNDEILKFNKDGKLDYQYILDTLEMTPREIAMKITGRGPSLWYNWVIGRNNPSMKSINKIKELLANKLGDKNEEIQEKTLFNTDITTSSEISKEQKDEATNTTRDKKGILDPYSSVKTEYLTKIENEHRELILENAQLKRTINCYEKLIERL